MPSGRVAIDPEAARVVTGGVPLATTSPGCGPTVTPLLCLLPFQTLDVYKAAKELARCVHEAGIRDAELRDQATRASKSTFLGLCEGLPSDSAGVRRRHFEIANNSLHEYEAAPQRKTKFSWSLARRSLSRRAAIDLELRAA